MTMADSNISRRRNSVQELTDPKDASPRRESSPNYHSVEKDVDDLDLRNSLGIRQGLSTRDSGYHTDLSPATTVSPAANTIPQQHFIYSNLGHCEALESKSRNSLQQPNLPSPHPAATTPNTDCQAPPERTEKSGAHLCPITRSSASRRKVVYPVVHAPSPSLSESSDTNRVQFDFESDDDDTEDEAQRKNVNRYKQFAPTSNPRPHFDLSGNRINLRVTKPNDDDDDDNIFYKYNDALEKWDNASEPSTPRHSRGSQSPRPLRFYSEDSYDEDSFVGACGGCDPSSCGRSRSAPYFLTDQMPDQDMGIFLESTHLRDRDDGEPARGSTMEGNCPHSNESISFIDSDSSLTGSQGFKPGYFDSDSRDSDSNNVFSCDLNDDEDPQAARGSSHAGTIIRDRPTQRTVSSARQRRHCVTTNPLMTLECLPPWCTTFGGVSVSTQTPHVTSVMIQQILHTPIPLPNEARGTAASRLHRLSESGLPQPPGPTPLPDIIASVGRDRSQSVPNLQTIVSRQRAREVGRELRRLSDEFNFRRNLTPVNEEFDGHPASYPRMHPSHLRNTINQVGAMLRDTFRGRHNSSS